MKGLEYHSDSSIPQQQQKVRDGGEVCPGLKQEDIEKSKRCYLAVVELVGEKRAWAYGIKHFKGLRCYIVVNFPKL